MVKKTNLTLIFFILPFIFISLFLINEISYKLFIKQVIYIGIGMIAFLVIYLIPIRKFLWIIPFLYWTNILLLLLVDIGGIKILGAQRWLKIPFMDLTIQPSEFMKTTLLLMLGYLIYKNPPKPYYNLKEFLEIAFFIILPFI
ncbi:MAG TPA: rod shape-determining protein RodA, partial [Hydrogenothermaceae bacterium]|nr:rod shape-determining protein RodA [Hydrogenothermaceae bacterium]